MVAREHIEEPTGDERSSARSSEPAHRGPTSGERLPSSTAAYFEARYAHDFSAVRVHADATSGADTNHLRAHAFTSGSDIHFAPGQYSPHTMDGQRLIAHELAHVVQQDGREPTGVTPDLSGEQAADQAADRALAGGTAHVPALAASGPQLQAATLGARFNAALSTRDWDLAVRTLEEMPPTEAAAALATLDSDALGRLSTTARAIDPSGSASSTRAIASALLERSGPSSNVTAAPSVGEDVAGLSAVQKLGRAWDFARPEIAPAALREVEALFAPASLIAMAAFAALYVAAQLTPAGWVADALALTVLSLSILFVGKVVLDIAQDLWQFFSAVNAGNEQDLRRSGSALARALARGAVGIVVALLSRALPRGGGPRPSATAELVPPGMGRMRIPVRIATLSEVPAAVPVATRYASYAVMMSPGGGGSGSGPTEQNSSASSGSGGGAASRPARGPEIWDEITAELSLEPPGTGASRGGGIRGAVRDAIAGGLVDPAGRPGTTDLATHPHSSAPAVRAETGTTGAQTNSAHVAPTSFVRGTNGYSRSSALTTGLDPITHRLFDSWKSWARAQRRAGRTTCLVRELYARMVDDIAQIPDQMMSQRTKNALAWRLEQEFRELGLGMDSTLDLPYKNIAPE